MVRIGIIGGAGYTAGELIRLIINHPEAELTFVHSTSHAGELVANVHGGIIGDTDALFCSEYNLDSVDVLFLCQGHGKSRAFWAENERPIGLKVIDLAQDYRDETDGYVYGLPEWQREKIASSTLIANPGCFATAIQLALLPLAQSHFINDEVNITAITGSTGAGVKPSATTHFSWRNDNISVYKAFEHQHLLEIRRNLSIIQSADSGLPGIENLPAINFVPMRGDFARGILAAVYTYCPLSEADAVDLYKEYYADAAFTFVSEGAIDLKQVTNTNKAVLHLEKHGDKLLITSAIDNLLKGASGQAIQNMNLVLGCGETKGLDL